jgi:hypothetical protein
MNRRELEYMFDEVKKKIEVFKTVNGVYSYRSLTEEVRKDIIIVMKRTLEINEEIEG